MKLQAINVGQGDCFILERGNGKNDLIIDTGLGTKDFTVYLDKSKAYDLLLTHSHKDHIGGFQHIIQEKIQIENIYVPMIFNELYKIFYMIVNNGKKYLSNSRSLYLKDDKKTLDKLNDFIEYVKKTGVKVIPVYYGYKELDSTFLNPFIDEENLLNLFGVPKEFDFRLDNKVKYQNGLIDGNFELSELNISDNNDKYTDEQKKRITKMILFGLQQKLNIFVEKKDTESYRELSKEFHKYPNKCSIIFQYNNKGVENNILMTGDGEIENFEIIMKSSLSEELKAKILKVPHHGSRGGLNEEIIEFINPEISIISHDNRVFGRGESHPHCEVLEKLLLLPENNILMTNSITKSKKPCIFPCIKGTRIFSPCCGIHPTHKKISIKISKDKIDFKF